MPQTTEVGRGICLGIGGTNARSSTCEGGDITDFEVVDTPGRADYFFRWMARRILEGADQGAEWAVIGAPGPVERIGQRTLIGPFENILGLKAKHGYWLEDKLAGAEPAYLRLKEQGFHVVAVNDGDLAAQAAAVIISEGSHNKIADVINGTGTGGAVVSKLPGETDVARPIYAPVPLPFEIGHVVIGEHPEQTFENAYSGTAIENATGRSPEELPSDHPIWDKVGIGLGQMATLMANIAGAELVVISGGVGIGSYSNYRGRLGAFMEEYRQKGNDTQKKLTPEVQVVPIGMIKTFEMYGAEGVMRYVRSLAA